MKSLLRSQTVKTAMGVIIGLGVVVAIAFAVDANTNRGSIDQGDAKKIALKEAAVDKDRLRSLAISDNGNHYTVTFSDDDYDYTYSINKNGEVTDSSLIKRDTLVDNTTKDMTSDSKDNSTVKDGSKGESSTKPAQSTSDFQTVSIDEAKAKEIALVDADVSEADTSFMWAKKDYDDGSEVWDVEFYANGVEYDYEIKVADGKIISKDHDAEHYYQSQNTNNTTSDIISIDEAKSIALGKVNGATTDDIRIQLDRDDGYMIYEGEIYYDGMEYEFEIDAQSGNVLEWSVESWRK